MTEKCPFQFDLMNPERMSKGVPFDAFKTLREKCPVSLQDDTIRNASYWAVTKRDDLDFVSKHPELFSSSENLAHPQPGGDDPEGVEIMRQLIINMDPPDHIKYRRVVRNAFTGKAVDALEPMMRQYAKEIIDNVVKKGECEFVSEVAAEMPLFVICALMEMPSDDRQKFSDLVDIMIGMDDPELGVTTEMGQLAAAQIFEIAMNLAVQHKINPTKGSVLDALLNGVVEGEALNEFEFCTFFLILIAGGVETTRTATSHGMRLLIEHPAELQKLVDDPTLIPDAVEEILRFYPSFNYMQRTAKEDVTVGDMQIPKGDIVRMYYPSVNHDPEIFGDDSEVFDVSRARRMTNLRNEHRTFGIGQHFCLGSHLARKELVVMFEELIPRLRNPRLVGAPHNLVSNFIPAIKSMKIAFDAA
ncbi:MAG: cytochrome P450 [Cellvibrionales bacterium]|jgi:cholest-4-en-3-one 26-monooxygenase|nr:cytochrome P450 [Cellvibrionales bacterium]